MVKQRVKVIKIEDIVKEALLDQSRLLCKDVINTEKVETLVEVLVELEQYAMALQLSSHHRVHLHYALAFYL